MVKELDETLGALAEPTRRRAVELLLERPRRAGELAAALGISGPALSRHLRVLRRSGIIEEERVDADARLRVYRLRPERFLALSAWLDRLGAYWRDQLAAFKEHAERTHGSEPSAGDRDEGNE